MLRETRYANSPGGKKDGVVKYLIEEGRCTFSGMSGRDFMSTVNAAEHVIEAIASVEGLDVSRTEFFDLMTEHGYPHFGPGKFDFQHLTVEIVADQPNITGWSVRECPLEVLQLFGINPA